MRIKIPRKHVKDLMDDLDRFESTFDHLSNNDGDEADELANVASYWLDRFSIYYRRAGRCDGDYGVNAERKSLDWG